MKINLRVILIIIFTSSASGLLINFIRPDGIPLIAEKKILSWAADSLFISESVPLPKPEKNDPYEARDDAEVKSESIDPAEISKADAPPVKEPPAINLEQAKQLYDKNALFIDAREKGDYDNTHIKNAISIPFDNFDEYKHIMGDIPENKIIVTYCGGTDCDLSILLGNTLFELGYKNVYIFFGGWNDWKAADYPVESKNEENNIK